MQNATDRKTWKEKGWQLWQKVKPIVLRLLFRFVRKQLDKNEKGK